MSKSQTYSFKHVNVTVGAYKMEGFGEEGGAVITRSEGKFVMTPGADGRVSRSFVASDAGTIAITLMQTSKSNEVLSNLLALDEKTLQAQTTVAVHDTLGASTYMSNDAWLQGPPEVSMNKGVEEYTWTFDCADLSMYIAGGQGSFLAAAGNTISSLLS
jgi:hypothetical protein